MKSLERRLSTALLFSLVLLLLLFWAFVTFFLRSMTEEFVASRLAHDAESLVAAADLTAGLTLAEPAAGTIYQRAFSGHYYVVMADSERLRSRSLWDTELLVRRLPAGEMLHWRTEGPMGQQLLVYAAGYEKQSRGITVAVAEDISRIGASLDSFNAVFAILTTLAALALIAVQRGVVRGAFRSLDRLRTAMAHLEAGQIESLPESVPVEVQPLVVEVNRLLAQMRRRVERSRTAVGNLAHGLKGPLNLLLRAADTDTALREPVEQLREVIERELRRARIAGAGATGRRFKPEEEMPTLVKLLERVYEDRSLSIVWEAEPFAEPVLDRDDMLELLGNLLDNACKWARTRVMCRIVTERGALAVAVEDDGPGIRESDAAELTSRGKRIDESRPGHGLGLAIVRDIADSYGARVELGRAALGGLGVRIVFPLDPLSDGSPV